MELKKESEFYEATDDAIDNFDSLNDQYRNTWNWIKEDHIAKSEDVVSDNINLLKTFQAIHIPYEEMNENIGFSSEYKERETDPLERLANLKVELIDVTKELEEYSEKYKDNEFIRETDNYEKIFKDLEIYKSKIDAFIDYDIYNKLDENDDSKSGGSEKGSAKDDSMDKKKQFTSLYEKYNRITDNLISQIKSNESNILKGNNQEFLIKYEILANPEKQLETLNHRIVDLEDMISNMEKVIGNWDQYNNNESISFCLTKLINFSASKLNERYEKKYQIFKDCGNLINGFIEKRKEKIEIGSYFLKIKEIYSIYELFDQFEQIFEYIKHRINALKEIYDNSENFVNLLEEIQSRIAKNEKKYKHLQDKYDDVLKTFEEFEKVLTDIKLLDDEVKDILI